MEDEGRGERKSKEEKERSRKGRKEEDGGVVMLGFSGQVREWRAVSQAASRQHVGQRNL
jgi:hypothetical protein